MLSGKTLLLVGAAALLPPLSGQVSARAPETAARPFAPPEAPLVLTRTVWRSLANGKEIVVRRRYTVQFIRDGDGFQLEGRLLDAAVEAPPLLAALAELERKRSDAGLFPLLLDASGRIRGDAGATAVPPVSRDPALGNAQSLLVAAPLDPAQRQESGAFLKQLAAQGAIAAWPEDLFSPDPSERREQRRIALPDGQEGAIDVLIKALGPQPNGLIRTVERTVTTVMAGTVRTSREQWTLAPADPVLH